MWNNSRLVHILLLFTTLVHWVVILGMSLLRSVLILYTLIRLREC